MATTNRSSFCCFLNSYSSARSGTTENNWRTSALPNRRLGAHQLHRRPLQAGRQSHLVCERWAGRAAEAAQIRDDCIGTRGPGDLGAGPAVSRGATSFSQWRHEAEGEWRVEWGVIWFDWLTVANIDFTVCGCSLVVLLAQQRGVRGGRSAAEGAGLGVAREWQRLRQQLARRSGARYVIPGNICYQNLIAFSSTKRSQQYGLAPNGPGAQCPAAAGAGPGCHLSGRQPPLQLLAGVQAQQGWVRSSSFDKC